MIQLNIIIVCAIYTPQRCPIIIVYYVCAIIYLRNDLLL